MRYDEMMTDLEHSDGGPQQRVKVFSVTDSRVWVTELASK